ncbi:MAG: potassium channel family protein [Chloroflexota bacterium]|nr:potassium channel family protein [Chloroflexota bacterium]
MSEAIEGVAGVVLVALVLLDVFLTVVVPRRAPRAGSHLRLTRYVVPGLWIGWRQVGLRLPSAERRETFLGTYGALIVMVLLIAWVAGLVLGYGLVLDALRAQLRPQPETFGTSLYFAGTSLLTLGFGDFVAVGGLARMVALVAGGTGLGLFALCITFLFTLYGSFQRREVAVVVLEAGAGAPPSGVTLLETYAMLHILDDLPGVFRDWQSWAAEVLDSHLAYPTLAYFRSSHDNDSWISSLGAVMDASTLVLTTIKNGPKGWAKLSRSVGGHCLEDLVAYFGLATVPEVGVERAEFDEARRRLEAAGFALEDADTSWDHFARLRQEYAGRVNALARYWATPPAQWIGDRSPLRYPRLHGPEPEITGRIVADPPRAGIG